MKITILRIILFSAVMLLATRLTELQIIKGEYFRSLSEGNRLRAVTIEAPRGRILARGGEVLAENVEVKKTVIFDPKSGYTKEPATADTPPDEVLVEWSRAYPTGALLGHVTGYLGEVDAEEVGKPSPHCMSRGVREQKSLLGRSGLEEQYDCVLRGINGEELVEVDIAGHRIRTMGRKQPIPGTDVSTTIDYGLQKKLAESFEGAIGAAVATDNSGQILALYSNPSFDPSLFIAPRAQTTKELSQLFNDPKLPLFNRAISGVYHPGSIFKIITATAALEERTITSQFKYTDTGNVSVNGFNYSTWFFTQYGQTEGEITLRRALSRSTDTFFYVVGQMIGIDKLVSWSDRYGIGKRTGVDLPGEVSGLLPSPEWKEKVLGERWFLGNTYHFSIGQGDLLVSPLQANLLASVISNGGSYCSPYITFLKQKDATCTKLPIAPETLEEIKIGMTQACETGGTAFPFFDFEPKVACKTGTAETGEKSPTHAWFTVFGPVENPEITLSVLVEKGGEGSKVAAPIARKVFDYWFHERNQNASPAQ